MTTLKQNKINRAVCLVLCMIILFIIPSCSSALGINNSLVYTQKIDSKTDNTAALLKVTMIDVKQGDSILVQQGTSTMLIDTGDRDAKDTLLTYLKKHNITKVDTLVLTHPHSDHIANGDEIINKYVPKVIYAPKVTSTTKAYRDIVSAMKKHGLKFTTPIPGSTFKVGTATCTILAPNSEKYEDTNDYSIVMKLSYGKDISFLFTGDAAKLSETEMIKKGYDISSTVWKVGHHGSLHSSSSQFAKAVGAKFALLSVAHENAYFHPHKATMDKLKERNIPVYRTDQCGTVVCTTDGKTISFSTKPGNYDYPKSKNK